MATAFITDAGPDCDESMVQVLEGVVYVVADEDEYVLTPGDSVSIKAGTSYRRWDAGDDEARWVELHCAA